VVALSGGAAAIQLVAYLVAERSTSPPPSPTALRRHLRQRLPEPMLPQDYVFLAALPRNASGKLDRRRLPPPPAPGAAPAGTAAALPAGPVEEALAGLFAEVLERDVVDAEADFFALGGHSLLATQVISRLRGRYQVEVSARELLEAPSVAALSAALRADPVRYERLEKSAIALRRVAALSDEEVERLLAQAASGDTALPETALPAASGDGRAGA
jgi:acyl carrier protein